MISGLYAMPIKNRCLVCASSYGGIDRKKIFTDGIDRDNFLNRLGNILTKTQTACFFWVLIPNHFHLLLKAGTTSISTVMRKLLIGIGRRKIL